MKSCVTVDETIDLLNEALRLDPAAVNALVRARVFCSSILANHPSIQCSYQDGTSKVGLVGILNGLFGVYEDGDPKTIGYGPIGGLQEDGIVKQFVRTRPSDV